MKFTTFHFHIFIFYFFFHLTHAQLLAPNSSHFRVKSGNLNGNTDLILAEFSFTFDEDLYFHYPAHCAAGLCAPQFQEAAVADDPCFPLPCDFTAKGDRCGVAAHPDCEARCAALRPTLCTPLQDWEVLEVGAETAPFEVTPRAYKYFRFNWDRPCKAVHVAITTMYGHLSAFISTDTWDISTRNACTFTSIPESFATICPSHQRCYQYGTYIVLVRAWSHASLGTIKVSALDIEDSPLRLAPPPGAPPVVPQPALLQSHVPLQPAVPLAWTFEGDAAYLPLVLSTTYCGVLHLQVELAAYAYPYDFLAVFVSLDNPFPSDPVRDMTFFAAISQTFFVCPSQDAPVVNFFVGIARNYGQYYGLPLSFYVTVDYERPGLLHPPDLRIGDRGTFSNYTQFPDAYWYNYASGMFRIDCPLPGGGSTTLSCRQGCNKFQCCLNTWPSFPTDALQFLFPIPDAIRLRNEYNIFTDYEYPPLEVNPRRAGVVMLLSRSYSGSPIFGPLGEHWQALLPGCRVSGDLSAMTSRNGSWVGRLDVPLEADPPPCDLDAFVGVAGEISRIIDTMAGFAQDTAPHSLDRSISLRFRADSFAFSDPWLGCTDFVLGSALLPALLNLTTEQTTVCRGDLDPADPCCNPALWDQCCVPRVLSFSQRQPSLPDAALVEGACALPSCTTSSLATYSRGSLANLLGKCNPPTKSASLVTTVAMQAYSALFDRYFGITELGLACYRDADCIAAPVSRCDLLTRRCVLSLAEALSFFLRDFLAAIAPSTRLTFIKQHGWTDLVATIPLETLVQQAFSTGACINANFGHPISSLRDYFASHTGFPGCPRCDVYYSLDASRAPPPWCSERNWVGSNCAYQIDLVDSQAGPEECLEELRWCNADPFLPSLADCENGQSFCGVCESPAYCHVLPSIADAASCAQARVCILADGSILEGLSPEECAARFSCSAPCPGGAPCATESQCAQQGACTDSEGIYYMIGATAWAASHSMQGFCAFPMAPLNNPDCAYLYPGSNPSSFGCVRMGTCVPGPAFSLSCTVGFDTQGACTSAGGTWYPRPTTRALCEAPVLCDAPELVGLKTSTVQTNYLFLVNMSAQDCAACDGTVRPINAWIPAVWAEGTSRGASWTERRLVSVYGWENSTFDFAAFVEDFVHAAEESISFQLLNNLQCSREYEVTETARIACACLSQQQDPHRCFQSDFQTISLGEFCPFQRNDVVAPPFRLTSHNDTLSDQLAFRCIVVNITEVPVRTFDPVPVVTVTDAFRRKPQAVPRDTFQSVYNAKGAIVGQVLGSGIIVDFSRGDASLFQGPLLICFDLSQDVVPDFAQYPVFDFGRPRSIQPPSVRVLPLETAVVHYPSSNTLCGNVSFPRNARSFMLVPILRQQHFGGKQGDSFTSGEMACLYAVAALFTLGGVALLGCWLRMLSRVGLAFLHIHSLDLIYLTVFAMRAIYLYLVPSGVLNHHYSDQLADYFMMDFPICLYLIANLQVCLSFVFLFHKIKHSAFANKLRNFWACFAIGAFLILMLFFSILLAFRYQVLDEDPVSGSLVCPTYYNPSGTARAIRLVYQSLIIFISLCIGITELILGSFLSKKVSEFESSDRILFCGVVGCLGIISDSTAFLIYYIVSDPHPYFSIVLIFTELIPILLIIIPLTLRAQAPVVGTSGSSNGSRFSFKSRPSKGSKGSRSS